MRRFSLVFTACLVLGCGRLAPDRAQPEVLRGSPSLSQERPPVRADEPPVAVAALGSARAAAPSAASMASVAAAPRGPLSAFFDDLRALESGARGTHVRVLWLGDSHTAADFLTGSVRGLLQARFGDGGPGFVRVGTRGYRHSGVKVARGGDWNVDPDPPARRSVQGDGLYGWAGTRAVPRANASFSLELSPRPGPGDTGSYELSYVLPKGSSFELTLGGKRSAIAAQSSSDVSAGITHLTLAAPLSSRLVLTARAGAPQLLGVVVERSARAGLVLDAAGIDGARVETPLAWDEAAFRAEVARRAPSLFVVAYGTNEAFDALKVERYGPQLARLVARLRAAAPGASCLVLGPTDAARAGVSVPRVLEVTHALAGASRELDCSFASLSELMGGEGSFARGMKEKERLAQSDGLHLTPKGYLELGQALGQKLLAAYSGGSADLP